MMYERLMGMGVALVTPFTHEKAVDYVALERMVDHQLQNGTDFLCILGTTAETPTLTTNEKREIRKRIIKQVNGRIPILCGCGGNSTQAIIEELQNDDFTGVDALLSVVPYYNKPTQEGIYQHFKAIASSIPLPIYLYNIPGRTGVNMLPSTVVKLASDFDNIIGIKEACGDMNQIKELISIKPNDFDILSGDDSLTCDMYKEGGVGIISVFGNAYPSELRSMVRLLQNGDFVGAFKYHELFSQLFHLLFVDGNPAGIKTILLQMGLIKNELRLPLMPARSETISSIKSAMSVLKL